MKMNRNDNHLSPTQTQRMNLLARMIFGFLVTIKNSALQPVSGTCMIIALLAFGAAQSSLAGTTNWTGSTSTSLEAGGNWTGGVIPAATDIAQFGTSGANQPKLTITRSINGLSFTNLTAGWTLSGTIESPTGSPQVLTTGSGGISALNTSATNTITADLNASAAQTFSVATGGTLSLRKVAGSAANIIGSSGKLGTVELAGLSDNANLSPVVAFGTLVLNKGTSLGTNNGSSVNNITVNSGATVRFGPNRTSRGSGNFTGQIFNTATVNGTMDLNGDGTFLDNWQIQTLNGSGTILNNGSGEAQLRVRNNNAGNTTFSGVIQDGTAKTDLRLDAASAAGANPTLTLSGANTYTGDTSFSGTTANPRLRLSNANALQNSTLNCGGSATTRIEFNTGIPTFTMGGLSGTSASANIALNDLASAAITVQIGNNNQTTTYAGTLSGTGSLTKIGTGSLTLSGSASYGGSTTVNGGALILSGSATYPGVTTVNNGSLTVNGSLPSSSAVIVNAPGRFGGIATISGPVTLNTGNAAINLVDTVIGTLTLANGLTLNDGNVLSFELGASPDQIAVSGTFIHNGTATINLASLATIPNGTYTLISGAGITTTNGFILGIVPGGYTATLVSDGSNLQVTTVSTAPFAAYWEGDVSGVWSTLNAGPNSNWATNSDGTGDPGVLPGSPTAVIFGATGAANFNTTLGQNFSINSLTLTTSTNITIGGANSLTLLAGLTNSSTTGTNIISAGSLAFITSPTPTVENDAASLFTISSPITSGFPLTFAGTGTIILSGSNSQNGLILSSGTLLLGRTNALGVGLASVSSGATLDLNGQTVTNSFSALVGAGVGGIGALINNGAAVAITGTITDGANAFTVGGSGNIDLARVTGGGGLTITKIGVNTLTLSGALDNAFLGLINNSGATILAKASGGGVRAVGSGAVTINGGTVQLGGTGGDQIFDPTTTAVNAGVFDINTRLETVANLSIGASDGSTSGSVTGTSGILSVTAGIAAQSGLISAVLAGTASLTKTTPSTVTLSSASLYTGNTTNAAGTLALSGSISNSPLINIAAGATLDVTGRPDQTLTLLSGQTLMGNGSINGNLITLAGSLTSPGASVGTLTVTNNIHLAGNLLLELDRSASPNCDQLVSVLGTITYGGTLSVTNIGTALQVGDTFQLFPGAVTTFSSINIATKDLPNGYNYTWNNRIAIDGSIQVASATAIPPVTWWQGDVNGNWNTISPTSNWDTDETSGIHTAGLPEATSAVHFSADSAAIFNTTLGANFTINSLSFDTAPSVSIAGANSLTVLAGINNSSVAGNNTISAGSLALGASQTLVNDSINPLAISSPISGAYLLTLAGAGTTLLSGSNSHSGMIVSSGTLQIGNSNALAAVSNLVSSGATLDLNGKTSVRGLSSLLGTGIGGNGALVNNSGSAAGVLGDISVGNNTFTVGGIGDINLTRVTGAGGLTLTKIGNNTLTLSGATDNAFLGLVVNSGNVILTKASGGGVRAIGGGITIFGGALQLAGSGGDLIYDPNTVTVSGGAFDANGRSETFTALNIFGAGAGSGALINNNGSTTSTLTINNGTTLTGDTTIGGSANLNLPNPVNGGSALIKVGAGTLTLPAINTYSGPTTVSNGTLIVSTRHAGNGDFTVEDAAALAVTNVQNGLSAAMGNLTLGNSGTTTCQFQNVASTTVPVINAAVALTVNGTCNVNIADKVGLAASNTYPLIKYGSLAGSGAFSLSVPPGVVATLTNDTSNLWIALNVSRFINLNPTNLTAVISGNTLQLSWPGDHLGWTVQTNSTSLTNPAAWFPYPGSSSVTNLNITINPGRPSVFFRMVYP